MALSDLNKERSDSPDTLVGGGVAKRPEIAPDSVGAKAISDIDQLLRQVDSANVSPQTLVGGKRPDFAAVSGKGSDTPATPAYRSVRDAGEFPVGASRYEKRDELDRGGCGVVFRAFDRQLQREVVVKQILSDGKISASTEARFLHEARITGRLEHPGIVPVYELGRNEQDQAPFYSMKWLQGRTLVQVISEYHEKSNGAEKTRALHSLLDRFHQVCQTLAYAHRMGVVHRDLKPANIYIGQFGETVVLDWGLAKQLGDATAHEDAEGELEGSIAAVLPSQDVTLGSNPQAIDRPASSAKRSSDSSDSLTQQGTVLGTAAYMSPEQAKGQSDRVDRRSDVFALGVILYEILSGKSPFRSDSLYTTLERVARGVYKPLRTESRGIPRRLEAICRKAMSLDPADRYADAMELGADIENYLAGDAVSAYREPWWGKLDRIANRHRAVVWSALLITFSIAIAAVISIASIKAAHENEKAARLAAEQQHDEKETALKREREAHAESLEQHQAARKAVDTWLIDLSGDLQFYPGLQPLRSELSDRAKEYYRNLARTKLSSTLHTIDVARAEIRLGDLQRLDRNAAAAWEHYEAAANALAVIPDKLEPEWDVVVQTQHANISIGKTMCLLLDRERLEEARSLSLETVQNAERAATSPYADDDARNSLMRAYQVRSRVLESSGDWLNASEILEKPIAMATERVANGGDVGDRRLLTTLMEDKARILYSAQRWDAAKKSYEKLVELYTEQLETVVNRPDWLEARAHARMKVGACCIQELDPDAAIEQYEMAEEDLHQAWEALYGEAARRENLAIANANLGLAWLTAGEYPEAEAALRQSIEMLQWLVKHEGADTERISRMVHLFLWLATTVHDPSGAEIQKLLEDAGILLDHLGETAQGDHDRDTTTDQNLRLQHLWLLAREQARKGLWAESVKSCEKAKTLLMPVLGEADHSWQNELQRGRFGALEAKSLRKLHEFEFSDRVRQDAIASLERAIESADQRHIASAYLSLLEMLCQPTLAHPTFDWNMGGQNRDDLKAAYEHAQRFSQRCEKLPMAWDWLAFTAALQNELDAGSRAVEKAKSLRSKPAPEDEILESLIRKRRGEQLGGEEQARLLQSLHGRRSDLLEMILHAYQ